MKALKYLLYFLVGLLALWAVLGLFAKHDYHIERSIDIEAPQPIVYEQVRLFKNLPNWSPWLYLDPQAKTNITGTDGEAGAVYTWSGNDKIGKGTQTLKSVSPNQIDMDVAFGDFSSSPARFVLSEKDQVTKVSWSLDMHVPFPWNAFAMLTDMNGFVGKDFENGLANLKKYCEALAPKKYRGYSIKELDMPEVYYATSRQVVDFQSISSYLGENFQKVVAESEKAGAKINGAPCGFYWTYDTIAMKTDMAAAMPLDKQVKTANGIQIVPIGGKALVIDYLGDYAKTGEAHGAMEDYMTEKKLQNVPPVVEEYVTDPGKEPDTAKWLTRIIYFVKPKADSASVEKK